MKIPTLHGYIDRRILINYTADSEIVRKIIPEPFRPRMYKGKAIIGVCLIRLKHIKPKGFPDFIGISSENAAHRVAVEWDEGDEVRQGVFIPRRDTSLWFNALVGGRLFPGKHYLAKFDVKEDNENYHIGISSSDNTQISIDAYVSDSFNSSSIFGTLNQASDFFKNGDVGYSPNHDKYDGMKLQAYNWKVKPLEVRDVHSSYYEDVKIFPEGSVQFDNALLMTKIEHEWKSIKDKPSFKNNPANPLHH